MFLRIIRNILICIGTFFFLVAAVVTAIVVSDRFDIPDRLSRWLQWFECYIRGLGASTEFQQWALVLALFALIVVGVIIIKIALSIQRTAQQ